MASALIDPESGGAIVQQARRMNALLLSRKTYDVFASYWPHAPERIPFTGLLNRVPKYVASRTLSHTPAWRGTKVLAGDLGEGVAAAKQRHGDAHVIGSLDLVQSLLRLGVVDRLHLWQYPLLLGSGKRVFGGGTVPTALRLTGSVTWPNGTLQLTYETAGAPTYGDLAIDTDNSQRSTDR